MINNALRADKLAMGITGQPKTHYITLISMLATAAIRACERMPSDWFIGTASLCLYSMRGTRVSVRPVQNYVCNFGLTGFGDVQYTRTCCLFNYILWIVLCFDFQLKVAERCDREYMVACYQDNRTGIIGIPILSNYVSRYRVSMMSSTTSANHSHIWVPESIPKCLWGTINVVFPVPICLVRSSEYSIAIASWYKNRRNGNWINLIMPAGIQIYWVYAMYIKKTLTAFSEATINPTASILLNQFPIKWIYNLKKVSFQSINIFRNSRSEWCNVNSRAIYKHTHSQSRF